MGSLTPTSAHDAIVVSGLGPMCRYGQSRHGLDLHAAAASVSATGDDWFDPQPHLGKHGHKYQVQASRMLWAATKVALGDAGLADVDDKVSQENAGLGEARPGGPSVGVCIGTNFAVHETLRGFDETIRSVGSGALQPMMAPNFSVNLPASLLSLKEGYQALNLTVTNPVVAGLESLIAAAGVIASERAATVIAGACEDATADGHGVEAAACALVLERASGLAARGAVGLARLAGHVQRFYAPSGARSPSPEDFRGWMDRLAQEAAAHAAASKRLIVSAPGGGAPLALRATEALAEAARAAGFEVVLRERAPALARLGCAAALIHGIASVGEGAPLVLLECSPFGHVVAIALAPVPAALNDDRGAA